MDWLTVASVICAIPVLLVLLSKWRFSYWKRRGVVQLEPQFFYGDLRSVYDFYDFFKLIKRNFRRMLSGEISLGEAFSDVYVTFKKLNLRFGGVYLAYKPQFIPLDVQLIKDIMVKSFSHFQDRGSYHHERDRLTQNLFRLEGDTWKRLRVKLSPTFTSSRMKMMFETLCEKIRSLPAVTDQCIRQGGRINLTEIAGRFTTDVIGSCAFGIECDSIRNPDCDFRYVFL